MKADIYYFSATGNSLTTAKMLADCLGDGSQCIPVASLPKTGTINIAADAVGFVFPVYYGDMPYILREAVGRMNFSGSPYIFCVPTYRGHQGAAAQRLNQLLRSHGQKLSLSWGVPMPGNSRLSSPEETAQMLSLQPERVREAAKHISAMEVSDYDSPEPLEPTMVDKPGNFRGIKADENCTGCGLCVNVCPMDNISLQDGHAQMGDNCITCLSCFHWCPVEAIYMSLDESIARRFKYRHPDIKQEDISAQKGQN